MEAVHILETTHVEDDSFYRVVRHCTEGERVGLCAVVVVQLQLAQEQCGAGAGICEAGPTLQPRAKQK